MCRFSVYFFLGGKYDDGKKKGITYLSGTLYRMQGLSDRMQGLEPASRRCDEKSRLFSKPARPESNSLQHHSLY
jgi:hypothetical protein